MARVSEQQSKISPAFMARLARLSKRQKVRAIVLLQIGGARTARPRQRKQAEREEAIAAVRRSAESALPAIDHLLEQFDGKRLAEGVSALGAVAVETTADGINALAALEQVKVIVEDQPVSSMSV